MLKPLRVILFSLTLLGSSYRADAQPGKTHRIGILESTATPETPDIRAFRQQLQKLGYVDEKDITIEYRSFGGIIARVPDLAAELVRLKVNVIVTAGTIVIRAIRQISDMTPIVMVASYDQADLVATPAKPERNVTGSYVNREISGKQLELLKETFPKLRHVAVLVDTVGTMRAPKRRSFLETERAARALGLELHPLEVESPEDFENVFQPPHIGVANGFLVLRGSPLVRTHATSVIERVEKNHLPAIYPDSTWPKNGGLMSYGPNRTEMWRRAAFHG